MRKVCLALVSLFFSGAYLTAVAQAAEDSVQVIAPHEITASYDRTVNLIFPYAIKSVDRGSAAILVQKAKGVENILQVKAAQRDFVPTNLSVITVDGKFHSFLVSYAAVPPMLNLRVDGSRDVWLADRMVNERELERASWQVLGKPVRMRLTATEQATTLTLEGIYLANHQLWLRLQVNNGSPIDFTPQYLRFFLRDKKRLKRTAEQETELSPVYRTKNELIPGLGSSAMAISFAPFTIPKRQRLVIQLGDETGGRVVQLSVKCKWLLRAQRLPLGVR